MSTLYDTLMARPDSVTYSKTGMLFGSQIVAETSDFTTQNPELAQMLPDYVENCVIGDILLNHKYTVNELMNSTDPLGLITSQPSPLRGIFKTTASTREFLTCRDAATQIRALANTEANTTSATFSMLTRKIFGNRVNGSTLLAKAMAESYGYFYAGGMSAAQIMKNNIKQRGSPGRERVCGPVFRYRQPAESGHRKRGNKTAPQLGGRKRAGNAYASVRAVTVDDDPGVSVPAGHCACCQ